MAAVVRAVPSHPFKWAVPSPVKLNRTTIAPEERRTPAGAPKPIEAVVERHVHGKENDAASLAIIEAAKAEARRREREERQKEFERRLQQRVRAANKKLTTRKVESDRPVMAAEEKARDISAMDPAELRERETLTIRVPTASNAPATPKGGDVHVETNALQSADYARRALESRRGIVPKQLPYEPASPTLREVHEARFGASLEAWGSKLREEYLGAPVSTEDNPPMERPRSRSPKGTKARSPRAASGGVVFVDDSDAVSDGADEESVVDETHLNGASQFVADHRRRLEEAQKARSHVHATRRAYMEAERQLAREMVRDDNHKRSLRRVRVPKEKARARQERIIADIERGPQKAPKLDPAEAQRIARQGEEAVKRVAAQRQSELERYTDALRRRLRDKCRRAGIAIPSLCACGRNAFDAHPSQCASNCPYKNNPRAHARALAALLESVGAM